MATNGLEKITEKILAEAEEKAAAILADAEAECNRIASEYDSKAEQIRERMTAEAEQKAADLVARAKSASAMEKRNLLQRQKSDLIESVFTDAREWVLKLEPARYSDLLAGLLSAALFEVVDTEEKNRVLYGEDEALPERYEVILNKKDREEYGDKVITAARTKLNGKVGAEKLERLVLSQNCAQMDGGVILRYGDVESNCSFDMVFSQLHRELEADVSQTLAFVRTKN